MSIKQRNSAEVELIPIKNIKVGPRLRKKIGPLASLTRSIKERGLMQPIIVRDDNDLVIGQRRFRACEKAGLRSIPARRWENLSDEEKHILEQDENMLRKDLDSYEISTQRLREVEAAEAEMKAEAISTESVEKPRRGRPQTSGVDAASRASGIPAQTIRDAQRHVSVADEFPRLQSSDWKQSHVLRADECLKEIGDEHRETFGKMISEPGIDRRTALEMLENVSGMPERERGKVASLYKSKKLEDQSLAKTRAAKVPPSPPAYLTQLRTVMKTILVVIPNTPKKYHAELRHAVSMMKLSLARMNAEYEAFKKKEMSS